jgi:hypothetical protein
MLEFIAFDAMSALNVKANESGSSRIKSALPKVRGCLKSRNPVTTEGTKIYTELTKG